jgi:nucleoside-diphosphate-sugar epimerase
VRGATSQHVVHELDAAHLSRLVLQTAPAGSRWPGAGDEDVPFRQIAEVIGRHLNMLAESISQQQAAAHFGFHGAIASRGLPWSSAEPRERLGWRPIHP